MNVLVVENDRHTRELLRDVLESRGNQVVACSSAEDGLRQFQANPFPLIFVDWQLPHMDGHSFCRCIRKLEEGRWVLIIAETDHSEETQLKEVLDAGADEFLTKPFDVSMMSMRLDIVDRRIAQLARQREIENQLRLSQQRFEVAVGGAAEGIWDWDIAANKTYYSPRFAEILGVAPEDVEDYFIHLEDNVHPDDRGKVPAAIVAHFEQNVPYDSVVRVRTASGEYRYLHGRGRALRDDQGRPLRMAGSMSDVTKEKQTELALRRQARILDQINESVVSTDSHGNITDWNRGAERLFGYQASEMIGQPFASLFPPDGSIQAIPFSSALVEPALYSGEFKLCRKNGDFFVARVSCNLFQDESNKPIGLIAYATDITHQRIAEHKLASQKKRLQAILATSSDAVFTINGTGMITSASAAVEKVFQYPENELLGKNLQTLFTSLESATSFPLSQLELVSILKNWRQPVPGQLREGTARRKDGSVFPVEISVGDLCSEGQENLAVFIRDVTQRHDLEGQIRHSQKLDAVGRLAGGIAHDFNNCLSVIVGYSEVALASLPPNTTLHTNVDQIRRAGERAASLTRQLLAFSRKQVLLPQVCNINVIVEEMIRMFERLIGEHIRLETRLDKRIGSVEVDRSQLEQVIMNLVINARDAMPEGGDLLIETSCRDVSNDVRWHRQHPNCDQVIMLAVQDSGNGIDEQFLPKIFEPFFTTKEEGKGTGLGLATVYGIVKQSDGEIQAFNHRGGGARFEILLPMVSDGSEDEAAHEPVGPAKRGSSEMILFVEDDEQIRTMTAMILSAAGYRVQTASNGEEAYTFFTNFADDIDLVITDLVMPNMGGRALMERVKLQRPDLPCLFVSGYSEEMLAAQGGIAPAVNLIRKPFRPTILLTAVRETLAAKRTKSAKVSQH